MSPADQSGREESDSKFYGQVTPRQMEGILSTEFGAGIDRSEGLHETSDESSLDMPTITLEDVADAGNITAIKINKALKPSLTLQVGRKLYEFKTVGDEVLVIYDGREIYRCAKAREAIEDAIWRLKRGELLNPSYEEESL